MVEKGIRRRICHSINTYTKANIKCMKDCEKNKDSSCLKYWDSNNFHGWAMPQKLPANGVDQVKDISQFNEDFIELYNEESDEGYFLTLILSILNNYMIFTMIYQFYLKE